MNEFNPFDDLGITFDDDNNLKESRRDRSYQNAYNPFDENPEIAREANVIPEETPDFSKPLVENQNLKDLQVKQELGITDLPEPMNDDEKQAYVDGLSSSDWKAWKQMKKEGYSFEARKAMMDNKEDMYDISKPGNEKFWSGNKNWIHEQMIESSQGAVDFQTEYIHPWSQTAQEWLQNESDALSSYSYDEIYQELLDKRIDDEDNALVRWLKRQAAKPDAFIKHEASIIGSYAFDIAKKSVDVLEQTTNIITQLNASLVNAFNTGQKGYDMVTVDTSQIPNIYGSYVRAVEDVLGVGFVTKYPIATYLLTTISEKSDLANFVITNVDKGFERCAEQIYEQSGWKDFDMQYLTPEEQQIAQENIKMSIYITTSALMEEGGKKFSESEALQNLQTASQVAKRTSRLSRQKAIESLNKTIETVEKIGEGTLENSKGTVLGRVTNGKFSLTTPGALQVGSMLLGESRKGFVKGMEWYYKNKDKWLVTRDPKAPEGELPKPYIDKEGEGKVEEGVKSPEKEVKIKDEIKEPEGEVKEPKTEVKTPEAKTPTPKGKKVETKTEKGTTIGEYIKKISNSITGKKGGLDKDLYEKLSTSKELQSEYINTIDPYLKSTGGENPSGVIQGQLDDFIKTVEGQLTDRRNKNIDFRKGQIKHKVEIPESDKAKWAQEDKEIKDLIKTLRNKNEDPELFLKYLLNLPKEKIAGFDKYIPNFSKNLGLINDTLRLTKAIASKDLLGKFLNFKSTWGTRNKNYIRKYLYKKLNEAYRKAGVKRNMYEIEQILNQLSEEQLVELEKIIESENNDPAVMNSFVGQVENSSQFAKRKKWIESGQEGFIPKSAIFDELTNQGYRSSEFEYDKIQSDKQKTDLKSILNTKYSDGTTPRERIDFYNIGLDPLHPGLLPWNISAQSLENGVIQFRNNLENFNAWILGHEIRHQVKGRLTTKELFDFYNNMVKSTKSIKLYEGDNREDMKGISEYMGLEKTRTGIEEYVADSFAQILVKGDLHELEDFLSPTIRGLDLSPKVNKIFSKICKDLWDNLSAFETANGFSTQVDELKKMINKVRPSKENIEMSKRRNYQWSPMSKTTKGGIKRGTDFHRLGLLQNINPELSNLKFDLDLKSDRLGSLVFEMEDGRQLNWEEFKNTLTEEQMKKFEQDPVLSSNERAEAIKNEEKTVQASMRKSDPLYEKYQNELKNIDPDIIGLIEKDGKVYVKYLMESQWERWELPDRPGYVEIKEVPAKDYFTEEEFNKLPKELQEKITGKEIIKYTKNDRSTHPESPTYHRTPDHQQLDSSELRWNGKDIGITEFFKDPNGLYYIEYLKPKNKNKYQKMEGNVLSEIDELDTILGYEPLGYQVNLLEKDISEDALRKINNQLPDKWKDIANQQLNIMMDDLRERFNQNRLLSSMEEEILGEERLKNASIDEIISIIKNDPETVLYQDAIEEGGRDLRIKLTDKNVIQQKYEILRDLEDLSNNHLEEGEERDLDFLSEIMERPNLKIFIDDFSDFFDKNGFLKRNYRRTTPKWTKENPWPREKLIEEMNKIDNIKDFENHIKKHFGKEYINIDDVETIIYNSNWDTPKYESYQKELKKWESKFDRLGEFLYIPKKD